MPDGGGISGGVTISAGGDLALAGDTAITEDAADNPRSKRAMLNQVFDPNTLRVAEEWPADVFFVGQ